MPQTTITRLPYIGSNHFQLFWIVSTIKGVTPSTSNSFWVDSPNILGTVKACVEREVTRNNMCKSNQKMKRLYYN